MHARRRPALIAALFITLAALATGCGGGGEAKSAVTIGSTTRPSSSSSNASTSSTSSTTRPTATTAAAAGTTVARADIKKTDWLGTLRAATGFSVDTTSPGTSVTQPYLNVSFAPSLAGYAVLDSITYGDISGDGFDEAIITV